MNIELQRTPWFTTEVFSFFVDEHYCDAVNDIVAKDSDDWQSGLKNVKAKTSNWDGLRYPVIKELANFASEKVLPSIGETKNFKHNNWITREAWINFYEKDNQAIPHHHFFSDFCGILITKTKESNLKFISPLMVHGYFKEFMNADSIQRINEKKGLFIFFPSYLFHQVEECKEERISVAFNFEAQDDKTKKQQDDFFAENRHLMKGDKND